MRKVDRVELTFENGDVLILPLSDFEKFLLRDIVRDLRVWRDRPDSVDTAYAAKEVVLEVKANAGVMYHPAIKAETGAVAFRRLTERRDLVCINLCFVDKSTEQYFVDWDPQSDDVNLFQTDVPLSNGNVLIVISKNRVASDS